MTGVLREREDLDTDRKKIMLTWRQRSISVILQTNKEKPKIANKLLEDSKEASTDSGRGPSEDHGLTVPYIKTPEVWDNIFLSFKILNLIFWNGICTELIWWSNKQYSVTNFDLLLPSKVYAKRMLDFFKKLSIDFIIRAC